VPELFSHDWHVQPNCQRPNRLPPERRAFSPGKSLGMRASRPHHTRFDCPRNLVKLSSHCSPVNSLCSQDFHLFCTARSSTSAAKAGRDLDRSARLKPRPTQKPNDVAVKTNDARLGSSVYAQQNASSALQGPMPNRQQAAAEEDSFEKRSLGGSCDNAKTLRGTLSPNAGLVAETNSRY
jgi:hypothetical protein